MWYPRWIKVCGKLSLLRCLSNASLSHAQLCYHHSHHGHQNGDHGDDQWWSWWSWQVHRWAEEVRLGWAAEPVWPKPPHLLPLDVASTNAANVGERKFQQFKLISNRLHNYAGARSDECPAGHSNVSILSLFGLTYQSSWQSSGMTITSDQ